MDVEVHDRNAFEAACESICRTDRDAVEQTEAHRRFARRVVPGRPHGAERARRTAVESRVDRRAYGAGSAQRGFERVRTHRGVGVEPHITFPRRVVEDHVDHRTVVREHELLARRAWRLDGVERREAVGVERFEHGLQPRR